MNNVCMSGKLCKGGELITMDNGKQLYRGSIAYWNSYKKDTEFYKFVIFGKRSYYFNEWVVDGDMISLTGSLTTNKWTDKSGVERKDVSINVADFDIFGKKADRAKKEPADDGRPDYMPESGEDLPF